MGTMSDIREKFRSHPGIETMSMRYGHGGKTEIYSMGEKEAELPAGSSSDQIMAAFQTSAALENPFESPKKKLRNYL